MFDSFPVPVLERMPTRIRPCPILEAVLEIRFVTSESWDILPGLLFSGIRERYPIESSLPAGKIPFDLFESGVIGLHVPLIEFRGENFIIHFGPRMLSLIARDPYPGWGSICREMSWLLEVLATVGFVREGERLGMRYVDFFDGDIFPNLVLDFRIGSESFSGPELSIAKVLRLGSFTTRLHVSNAACVPAESKVRNGSILDVDVWLGPRGFSLFENGMERFGQAHDLQKQIFFGLLKPDFLEQLNPEYI